jgi:hypothetical protein
MVSGLAIISIREQQQASDTDLSNRAIQAAQAAVRDAAQRLVANPDEEYPNCDPNDPRTHPNIDPSVTIVCRTVTRSSEYLEAPVAQDDSFQINTYKPNGASPNQMVILWDQSPSTAIAKYLPSQYYVSSDDYKGAAALELSIVYWPRQTGDTTGRINGPVQIYTSLILPGKDDLSPIQPRSLLSSSCDNRITIGAGSYNCQIFNSNETVQYNGKTLKTINLNPITTSAAANNNIVVRIKPRYADTNVYVQFFRDFTPVKVQSDEAVIDVTAKAGNLYRRIMATKPVGSSSAVDSVLFTGGKICKNLTVDENHNQLQGNNCGTANE